MNKLIKISEDNFVIIDEEFPKDGEYCLLVENNLLNTGIGKYSSSESKVFGVHKDSTIFKRITHSTQPLDGLEYLNLREIKELIDEVDIQGTAKLYVESQFGPPDEIVDRYLRVYRDNCKEDFLNGYNQCIENNKDKICIKKEYIQLLVDFGFNQNTKYGYINLAEMDEFVKSFQPKTEWNIEIIDGNKLKLKN